MSPKVSPENVAALFGKREPKETPDVSIEVTSGYVNLATVTAAQLFAAAESTAPVRRTKTNLEMRDDIIERLEEWMIASRQAKTPASKVDLIDSILRYVLFEAPLDVQAQIAQRATRR